MTNPLRSAIVRAIEKAEDIIFPRWDAWKNDVTGLGDPNYDKRIYGRIEHSVTLSDDALSALFHSDDLAERMVSIVPSEMFREGFDVHTGDPELDATIADKSADLDIAGAFVEAERWARCYGGSAIVLGAQDGRDASKPLIEERARDLTYLRVVDRRYLWPNSYYEDPESPKFGEPETYGVTTVNARSNPMAIVHESRLVLFRGSPTDARKRLELSGWDLSYLQRAHDVLRSFNVGWAAVETMLTDANQAIFRMTGLSESIGAKGEKYVSERLRLTNIYRSVLRALVIDADSNESFERQTPTLTGIPDTLEKMMLRLSAAVHIPVTILMGQSPAGMNATGDSDFRWFYNRIKSGQRVHMAPKIRRVVGVWLKSKKGQEYTKGKMPETLGVTFPNLWTPTPSEEATRKLAVSQADAANIQAQIFTPEEVALHRGREGGYDDDVRLSKEGINAREAMLKSDMAGLASGAPSGAASEDDATSAAPAAPEAAPDVALTASDLATIITVDEARKIKGFTPFPGPGGNLTITQFKAQNATPIADAAKAESGVDPKDPPPAPAGEQSGAPPFGRAPEAEKPKRFDSGGKAHVVEETRPDGSVVAHAFSSKAEAHKVGMAMRVTNPKVYVFKTNDAFRTKEARVASEKETHETVAKAYSSAAAAHRQAGNTSHAESYEKASQEHAEKAASASSEPGGGVFNPSRDERGRFDATALRVFELHREEDETGVSGTGIIASGVIFPDGRIALRWATKTASTTLFDKLEDVERVHGHGGKTRVVYLDVARADGDEPERDEKGRFAPGGGSGKRIETSTPSPEDFHATFEAAMKDNEYTAFVSHYSPEELAGMTRVAAHDGKTGLAVKDHGDGRIEATALYNAGGPKGAGVALLKQAVAEHGVNYVECYGEGLRAQYEGAGFQLSSGSSFDRSLAPSNWNYEKHGTPNYYTLRIPDKE